MLSKSLFFFKKTHLKDYKRSNDYEELDNENTPSDDILCIWKYPKCTIGLRFNCVSTEFTAKKHGGEKGIPFRFRVSWFLLV